ncbi:3-oxoacyl-reductase [Microdochium trichocladiopsis]|uniref:3-oxoacyl-reductase n=1 Tax=Microdochium trichocladiopsis TaxID=1682393 RepID=A0A9P9BHP0_9PEZI|nr:3-oxoacyl-reductase [Microdochium trichocladiopsis]KAH7012106.1 3-oxoacyl-reductase [Microdochium trichocladiopsis]
MDVPRVLQGKLAIITGASRNLGAACAEYLASRCANVVIVYASESSNDRAQKLADELEDKYTIKALPIQVDLSTVDGPQMVVNVAKKYFTDPKTGKFQIDIIINNAAIVNAQPLAELDIDLFQDVYNLNCRAPALLIKAALPYLPTDRSGRVVNISSATTAWAAWGQTSYAGSKGALEAMTRIWARELSERCTVNTVAPGPMASIPFKVRDFLKPFNTLTPLGMARPGIDSPEAVKLSEEIGCRPGYLEEVAGLVGIACLPESGWMTGSVLPATGGGTFTR